MNRVKALRSRAASSAIFILLCAGGALGVPLSDYHKRVKDALISIDTLTAALADEEGGQYADTASAVAAVRKLLPPDEAVEWEGGVLRVDNAWLAEALNDYEKLPPGDGKRLEALLRIVERLHAIDERLTEVERAAEARTINKDEEKARLAAILRRGEYAQQVDEGNALTRLLKRFREWLRSLFPSREPSDEPRRENPTLNAGVQLVVALLALAVLGYVLWRFLPRFLRRDLKKRQPKKRGARVVLGEKLGADESSADLLAEAEALARAGELRAAIRKGYIALLCELHDRKVLRLEQHKTNRDYLRAVQSNRPLYEEMQPLTASFENHWYGFAPATETDWEAFRARYRKAVMSGK